MKDRRIIAAAIRYGGVVISKPPPARHAALGLIARERGYPVAPPEDQGFIDNAGRFLTRAEALVVATAAGQVRQNPNAERSPIAPPDLYTEDLW
jgi:hypothetical protein